MFILYSIGNYASLLQGTVYTTITVIKFNNFVSCSVVAQGALCEHHLAPPAPQVIKQNIWFRANSALRSEAQRLLNGRSNAESRSSQLPGLPVVIRQKLPDGPEDAKAVPEALPGNLKLAQAAHYQTEPLCCRVPMGCFPVYCFSVRADKQEAGE